MCVVFGGRSTQHVARGPSCGPCGALSSDDVATAPRSRGGGVGVSGWHAFHPVPGCRAWLTYPGGPGLSSPGSALPVEDLPSGGLGPKGHVGPGVPSWRASPLSSFGVTPATDGVHVPQDAGLHKGVALSWGGCRPHSGVPSWRRPMLVQPFGVGVGLGVQNTRGAWETAEQSPRASLCALISASLFVNLFMVGPSFPAAETPLP